MGIYNIGGLFPNFLFGSRAKKRLRSSSIEDTLLNFSWETRNQGILWQEISHKKNRQEKREIKIGKKDIYLLVKRKIFIKFNISEKIVT